MKQLDIIDELISESLNYRVNQSRESLHNLGRITHNLVNQRVNEIQFDPLSSPRQRQLALMEEQLTEVLDGKTILITGASGCIASQLIRSLQSFKYKRLVLVDISPYMGELQLGDNVRFHQVDIRILPHLDHVFDCERPDVVFHLAAIRVPAVAEKRIHDTYSTNVCGTWNVVDLCEYYHVKYCVFSSTGKCSQYLSRHVYTVSKKLCEYIFSYAASSGHTNYIMARFTHVLDNSWINTVIDQGIKNGIVELHAPYRPMHIQNAREAAELLLNSIICSIDNRSLKFTVVRNLGWPIELLDIALHKIYVSGAGVPIYFSGIPDGYDESVFSGQLDWSGKLEDSNPLINALEVRTAQTDCNSSLIISSFLGRHTSIHEDTLKDIITSINANLLSPTELKVNLGRQLNDLVFTTFREIDPDALLQVLFWGLRYGVDQSVRTYQAEIELLLKSLFSRLNAQQVKMLPALKHLRLLAPALEQIPFDREEVNYLLGILREVD